MIYDFGTEVTANFPATTAHVSYSAAIDLTDGNDGVPALFGLGEQLYMQFEVTTAFTAGGNPLAQFGVAIDSNATLGATSIILGMTGGSILTKIGYHSDELTLGKKFHLAIPPFDDVMEDTELAWPTVKGSSELDTFRGLKYMGIVIHNPMDNSSTILFSAGGVKAWICT